MSVKVQILSTAVRVYLVLWRANFILPLGDVTQEYSAHVTKAIGKVFELVWLKI